MRIYHNIPALTAYNSLNATSNAMQKSIEKLSTGLRINSAADDAAGFAISEKMRAQISGMEMAQRNAQDGISMLQTAEGALGETHSILQRMRELAVQAANDTLTQEDRSYIQLEVDELKNQVDNIANTTQFNKKRLLDGSCAGNWSSNDLRVKAYVRGSLREVDQFGQKSAFEGNFRIRIDASATGAGEVQKTSIFKIKHPNVITDVSLNTKEGVEAVRVDNIPAGDFTIKASIPTAEASATVTGEYGFDDVSFTQTTWTSTALTGLTAADETNHPTTTVATYSLSNLALADNTANPAKTADKIIITFTDTNGETDTKEVTLTNSADVAGAVTDLGNANITGLTFDNDNGNLKVTAAGFTAVEITVEAGTNHDANVTPAATEVSNVTTYSGDTIKFTLTTGTDENGADITKEFEYEIAENVTTDAENLATALQDYSDANKWGIKFGTVEDTNGGKQLTATAEGVTKIAVTATAGNASQANPNVEPAVTSTANTTALTGVNALIDMTTTAENNASILFEVVSVGKDSVTLKASSNVLMADGTMENHTLDNIILTEGDSTNEIAGSSFDLGSLLGEVDAKFTMNLRASALASNFESGDKFVVNIVGQGTTAGDGSAITPDLTVKIAGTLDEKWPDTWADGDAKTTDNVTLEDLQFNLSSEEVQN
ncbi:MAG: hypothetical protein IJR21_01100, partial [Synergistaceae bacterium]|nr:hypothetical protein [Synergistaceae bacterium]